MRYLNNISLSIADGMSIREGEAMQRIKVMDSLPSENAAMKLISLE